MLFAKFGLNWPSGSAAEDENVHSLRQRRQRRRLRQRQWQLTNKFWSEKSLEPSAKVCLKKEDALNIAFI